MPKVQRIYYVLLFILYGDSGFADFIYGKWTILAVEIEYKTQIMQFKKIIIPDGFIAWWVNQLSTMWANKSEMVNGSPAGIF